jgi:DNA-directed RNA polymerase subunit RPC12/RpoP
MRGEGMKTEVARGSLPEVEEICARCGAHFTASAKRDFFGFRDFTCPSCHLRVVTPLKWSYRITYWVFLALVVYGLVRAYLDNGIKLEPGSPSGFVLLSLLLRAILMDLKLLYRLRRSGQQPGSVLT